jgi:hypothetical protein
LASPSVRAGLVGILRARLLALLVTAIVSGTNLGAGVVPADPVVDPDLSTLVHVGRTRVLVMLQVPESGDEGQRADAIGRAQDAVLSRLPDGHASVVRRYASIPMLALEIDAIALRALETMPDVVAAVKLDRSLKSQ